MGHGSRDGSLMLLAGRAASRYRALLGVCAQYGIPRRIVRSQWQYAAPVAFSPSAFCLAAYTVV